MADSALVLDLCDALAARIAAALASPTEAAVSREYVSTETVPDAAGLKVWVFPVRDFSEPLTRGEDQWTYEVAVVVTDFYGEQGKPADAWVDARKLFTEAAVTRPLDFSHGTFDFTTAAGTARRVWSVPTDQPVYDAEALATRKLFWWDGRFQFQEIQPAVTP